ncbi:hypothetical protein GLAREA_05897 [Glarea lozoyensis ATCC 20868]|uniref:Tropomyosin-2 n=2 Tax=Glarea lozoyensis TaxID=101852 RepID=S3D534_GLAL2|nr:uncharacterized protein GLAREA_05897 [Glarea lozoyensis ATCC 20868]EHK99815.1 putative Tropomyosin-2 [Glarea lozoyensis 74030]EPE32885.1 hypothetical protein GLAREA_05897 [Glarea lozoyensis ATCC 20868]
MEEIKRQKAEWEAIQDAHAAQVKEFNDRHTAQEYEVESLKRKIAQLEEEIAIADTTIDKLKENAKENGNLDAKHTIAEQGKVVLEQQIDEYISKLKVSGEILESSQAKAEHLTRKVQALEQANEDWEKKYEALEGQYKAVQKEYEEFQLEISNL